MFSLTSDESAVFEVGEDKCGSDDVADLAGTGGGVVEGALAAGEEGEAAFAQAAHAADG
ncbi:hypothetical protein [Actinokineospora iranica]|uniref:hypothetical protein n=1 Tax=Actinokineospora iranica TaxID=1271860 RepID=UPI0015879BBF|nr:hypothetical protein [Actinokineospora iranica]